MQNTQTPNLIDYIILNVSTMPKPWWDTLLAGIVYWLCMMCDFISHFTNFVCLSPAWGYGAKFATLCGVCSYMYKIVKWMRKTVKDYKNKKLT